MPREIPLTKGYVAIVDDDDHEWLSQWRWFALVGSNAVYAHRSVRIDGKRRTLRMHRAILGAPKGMGVDHIDHDGLNNTRANLRLCTQSQNLGNQRLRTDGTSAYKGVSWHTQRGKWQAHIKRDDKHKYLGLFTDEIDAALAYDAAARELFGEFAYLNFPNE
jgi:hypothetical protein